MADLLKIKKNVAKMASMNAPTEDIDGYIASEGVTIDDVRNFKTNTSFMNKLQEHIKLGYTEDVAPVLHGISTFGFGVPKAVVGKISPKAQEMIFSEQTTLPGKAKRFVSEAGGMLVGGGKFFKGAEAVTKAVIPALAGKKLLQKLGTGAITGGLTGGAYSLTDRENAGKKAALGAGLGVLGEGIGAAVGKGVVAFRRMRAPAKAPIKQRIGWMKQDIAKKTAKTVNQIKQEGVEARKVMIDNLNILKQDLDEAVNTGAKDIQERLPQFFKNNSEAYGKHLDDIADRLYKSNKPFTADDASIIINKTLNELDEIGVIEGRSRLLIEELRQKYPESTIGLKIDFKSFNEDIKKIYKSLSSGVSSGQRFAKEDIAGAVLKSNFGEYVAQNVPEFANLQQSYRPVVQAMKESGKWFKPYAGEYTNIGGANLLKRVASSKSTPQEQKLISMLEQGSEFSPGLGKVSERAVSVGKQIKEGGEKLSLQKMIERQNLEKIKSSATPRLEQLSARERQVSTLLANKQKAEKIRNILFGLSAAGGIIGTGMMGIGSLIRSIGKATDNP